jgi:2-oxoglutarate dehydrogenase E1 component
MNETVNLPNASSLSFIEGLYDDYLRDPLSVAPEWRRFFEGWQDGEPAPEKARPVPSFKPFSLFNPPSAGKAVDELACEEIRMAEMQDRVDQLVRAYRYRGHSIARFNPLDFPREHPEELKLETYGFTASDMDQQFVFKSLHPSGRHWR